MAAARAGLAKIERTRQPVAMSCHIATSNLKFGPGGWRRLGMAT